MCTGALGIEAYDWLLNSSIASLFVRPPVNRYVCFVLLMTYIHTVQLFVLTEAFDLYPCKGCAYLKWMHLKRNLICAFFSSFNMLAAQL